MDQDVLDMPFPLVILTALVVAGACAGIFLFRTPAAPALSGRCRG